MQGRHRAAAVRGLPDDVTRTHALLDAIDLIGSAPDLDETLRRIASVACTLGQAAYAAVELTGADALVRRVDHGDLPTGDDRSLTVDLLAHGAVLGQLTVGRPDAGIDGDDRSLVERLAALAAPLVANAVAFDESERHRRWLEGTVKVAAALAPTMRLEDARTQLVSGVSAVAGAALVALLEPDGRGEDRWQLVAHQGDEAQAAAAAEALSEEVAASGAGGQVRLVRRVAGRESLLIPLQTQHAPAGVLLVEQAGISSSLGALEQHLLSTFAGQVSLALDRAHAIGERQELLIAADRDRIARDLHDLVIQRLYSTGLQLQAARNGDAAGMGAAIAASVRDIDTSIRDLRATIFELGRGLTSTLSGEARGLVQEYAAALGFQPALRLSGPVDTALTASVADEALLVLREALSNIARHAHATAAQVELTASAAWFMLRVADDGVGMAPDAGVASGLRNAQRRAESLGGVIRMGAATPHGASLVWLVPAAR
ncbi:histidine kinase [Nocardioides sp. CER19]|uniref:sensor histidine kinase n=1 Tax=Nocardioides sp. CER19 TaxID=3038538 RepID=UPI002447A416|nr:histidine kinase [Nocardioides sp. CER19]MDH2414559.1 histidine kinase [Nocardioides sp. CER19]